MTKRVSRRVDRLRASASAPELRREAFPALSSFAKGYLHEDFPEVHGSARRALAAFCAEADPAERGQLAAELSSLVSAVAHRSTRDLRRFVTRELGSRWAPGSRDELVELLDLLRAC